MRAGIEKSWERTIARYFNAHGLPIKWEYVARRFQGIKGFSIVRLNPSVEESVWASIPKRLKSYESADRNANRESVIIVVTNRKYGDSVDDSIVVMRLGTFIPMLKALVHNDRERYL